MRKKINDSFLMNLLFFETPKLRQSNKSGSTAYLIFKNLFLNRISLYIQKKKQQHIMDNIYLHFDTLNAF